MTLPQSRDHHGRGVDRKEEESSKTLISGHGMLLQSWTGCTAPIVICTRTLQESATAGCIVGKVKQGRRKCVWPKAVSNECPGLMNSHYLETAQTSW